MPVLAAGPAMLGIMLLGISCLLASVALAQNTTIIPWLAPGVLRLRSVFVVSCPFLAWSCWKQHGFRVYEHSQRAGECLPHNARLAGMQIHSEQCCFMGTPPWLLRTVSLHVMHNLVSLRCIRSATKM